MRPDRPDRPSAAPQVHVLVESQDARTPDAGSHFLRAAHQLAVTGTRIVVLLIDDGVRCAVGGQPTLARLVAAGGEVWADEASLSQRALPVASLADGVTAASLDKIAPLLFDPDVTVVWH